MYHAGSDIKSELKMGEKLIAADQPIIFYRRERARLQGESQSG